MHHHSDGSKCCKCPIPLIVSGILFALIALVHLCKLLMGWSVTFNGHEVPAWTSGITFVIAGLMAAWDFWGSCCKKCKHECKHETTGTPPLQR